MATSEGRRKGRRAGERTELPGDPGARSERPAIRPGVVDRDELVARLASCAPGTLVVVSAPAGYGKSTTVALWERADPHPFAWVAIDRLDDDPVHLLQHIAASIDRVAPVPDDLSALVAAPGRSVADELVPAVLDHLSQVEPMVLVVDDVHLLVADEARATLALLAEGLDKEVRLALVSRSAVPVPLARRRLDDLLVEIGPADLALSVAETKLAFEQLGVPVDEATAEDLVARSEGWAAGLHLAALAARDRRAGAAPVLSGRQRLVADYLVEEVLAGLEPATTSFLEESAVLDELDADTLDDLLERDDSRQRLRTFEASGNLFLVPLDDERYRYRYHHLFGELLAERLRVRDPERAEALHRRAADHFEAVGDLDRAIVHALQAGDFDRASSLVLRDAAALAFDGRSGVLARRLALLGDRADETNVEAAVAMAWYGLSLADSALIIRSLQRAVAIDDGRRLGDGSKSAAVATALIRAALAPDGIHQMVRDADEVIAAGDWTTNPWWGLAMGMAGVAHGFLGEVDEARRHLLAALPALGPLPAFDAAARAWLALLDLDGDDLAGATKWSQEARRIADRHRLEALTPTMIIYSVDALVSARRGDRARAEASTATVDRLVERLGDAAARSGLINNLLLAQADLARGDGGAARAHVRAARRSAEREPEATWALDRLRRVEAQLEAGRTSSAYVTPLTEAERRVLPYLATHLSLQEVAAELHVSRNTAKTHSVAIYRKLGVSSRSEAVAEARRLGLLAD